MSEFTKMLVVSPLSDGKAWFLQEEFSYDVGEVGSGNTVQVPRWFVTDFASVPRPLWVVFPRWGRYGNAAVIHDFMYYDQSRSRKEADDIFLEAMEVLEVGWVKRRVMHLAVRTFGWIAWRGSKSRKNAGRSKVASRLPEKSFETKQSLGW